MPAPWLGPEDSWPRHGRPLARVAIAEAKRLGWSLRPGGHFGRLRCPARVCAVSLFSSSGPEDGSETARAVYRVLHPCPHGVPPSGEVTDAPAAESDARRRLAQLTRIADAADALATQALEDLRARRLLERALLEDSDAHLDDAAEHEARASAAEGAARRNAAAAEAADPWPPARGAQELVDRLIDGLAAVGPLVQLSEARDVTEAFARLTQRAEALQERIIVTE